MGYGIEEDNSDYFVEQLEAKIRDDEIRASINRHRDNSNSQVGTTIRCACCAKRILKKSYQTQFCSNKGEHNCKDEYWNTVNPRGITRHEG